MKKVVVGIQNGLLAEAITAMLSNNGEFQPYRTKTGKRSAVVQDCVLVNADILLLETTYAEESSLETRLNESRKVRSQLPDCKIVFLCDENSAPDIARSMPWVMTGLTLIARTPRPAPFAAPPRVRSATMSTTTVTASAMSAATRRLPSPATSLLWASQ